MDKNSLLDIILSILTLFLVFYLFYEYFFEHYYWNNRICLYRKLKSKEWFVVNEYSLSIDSTIIQYNLSNGGYIWLYTSSNKITYTENDYGYIGLFCTSPIMKYYNKKIIKLLN